MAALVLCGCATSHSLKAVEDSKFQKVEHAEASGEKHEGPWTETVYEFAPTADEKVAEGEGFEPPRAVNPRRFSGPVPCQFGQPSTCETVAPHGPLVKVTVRDYTGRDTTWQTSSDGLTGAETHVAIKTEDKAAPSSGCALGLGFWLAVGLGLLAFGGWVWLKRGLP